MTRTILLRFALGFLLARCGGPAPEPSRAPSAAPAESSAGPPRVVLGDDAIRSAGIALAEIEEVELADEIRVAGRVALDEDRTTRIGSFVEGVVVDCCRSVGEYVRKGDVLAQIHSHILHEIIAEHVTALAEQRARESELAYARQARERAARLLELQAGPLQALQRAETDLRGAETALEAARAAVERARAHLDFYGLEADEAHEPGPEHEPRIRIRAPAAGTILSRSVRLGDTVTPATEMYVMSDLSRLWVIAQVPERDLPALRVGMAVDVRTRAFPDKSFPGRVVHVSGELDPETLTVQVRCAVANPHGELKTGMYATVGLHGQGGRPATLAPEAAVQRLGLPGAGEQDVVFVAAGDGAFEARPVRLGRVTARGVEVLEGLRPGERVVVAGAFLLKSELLRDELAGDE